MFNKPKIHWMLDESIGNSKPRDWEKVIRIEKDVVNLIGSNKFNHTLPNPIKGLGKIASDLVGSHFSTIMDLTGWLTPSLRELFPSTPIVSDFSLSRVRVVSSPSLETSGYTVSMSQNEIYATKQDLDLSRPLIVDDTTFTGWTNTKTMELWGINPKNTTHAFLIANTGFLDRDHKVKGATRLLQYLGSEVFYGHELSTPDEDGWHLKDLHEHENLQAAFDMSLEVQKLIESEGPNSTTTLKFLGSEGVLRTIFPNAMRRDEVLKLTNEGKFIPSGKVNLGEDLVHTKNPFLWSSQYFRDHVDFQKIVKNRNEIKEKLGELKELTSDPEAKFEAAQELKNSMFNIKSFEGNLVANFGRRRI